MCEPTPVPPSPEVPKQRLYELLRLETVTETKDEIRKWAFRLLAVVVAFASLGAFTFIPMYVEKIVEKYLQTVVTDRVNSELDRAENAIDNIIAKAIDTTVSSQATVRTAEAAIVELRSTTDSTIVEIKETAEREVQEIIEKTRRIADTLQILQNNFDSMDSQRKAIEKKQAELDKKLKRTHDSMDRTIAGLAYRFREFEKATALGRRIIQALAEQVKSGTNLSEQTDAAIALAQYGEDARSEVNFLIAILQETRNVELQSPEEQFLTAVCIAIANIGDDEHIGALVDTLVDDKTRYPKMLAISNGLRSISPVTGRLVERLTGAFLARPHDGIAATEILEILDRGTDLEVDEPRTRMLIRDLFVEGLKRSDTLRVAAYAFDDDFADIGQPALEVLHKWRDDASLGAIVMEAVRNAIMAIENSKQ